MGNQFVGGSPGFLFRFPNNDVQANAVVQRASPLLCAPTHHGNFLRHLLNRFSPGEIGVDLARRYLQRFL
ncbi:hypothetical protein D3C71_1923380 [compost metagenome]